MKLTAFNIIALLLLVAGVVALVYGIVSLNDYRNSLAGSLTGAARELTKQLVGDRNVQRSDIERRAIAYIVVGSIGVVAGGALLFLKRR